MTKQKEEKTVTTENTKGTEVPQGDQSVKGAPQGTPAATGATESDQVDDKVDKPAREKRIRYSFPTVSRCPRCRTTDTVATSTQGKVQYRRCLRAICRWTYQVIGKKV